MTHNDTTAYTVRLVNAARPDSTPTTYVTYADDLVDACARAERVHLSRFPGVDAVRLTEAVEGDDRDRSDRAPVEDTETTRLVHACRECAESLVETDAHALAGWFGTNYRHGYERRFACPACGASGQDTYKDDGSAFRGGACAPRVEQ